MNYDDYWRYEDMYIVTAKVMKNIDQYAGTIERVVNEIIEDLCKKYSIVQYGYEEINIFVNRRGDDLIIDLVTRPGHEFLGRSYDGHREVKDGCWTKPESKKLTEEERDFAAAGHDVIYRFLNYYKLDRQEWYDVIVPGYLKAVRDYCRKESAKQYSFSTIAFRSMNDCVIKERRSRAAIKRQGENTALSLNAEMGDDSEEFSELIPDHKNLIDSFIEDYAVSEMIRTILAKLSEIGRQVFQLLIQGLRQSAIQKQLRLSRKAVKAYIAEVQSVTAAVCAG